MKTPILISIAIFSAFFVTNSFAEKAQNGNQLVISVNAQQSSLKDVLKDISKQTKWSIAIDVNLAERKVSGNFAEEQIETFLNKALKGENLVILFDEKRKTVEVRSFGKKSQQQIIVSENEINLFLSEEEQQKILANQINEHKKYEEYRINPDSIDPLTRMTLGEINALHAQEQKIHDTFSNNPNSIDPMTGLTLEEIATLHIKEKQFSQEYNNNPDSIDPLTGMTIGEITALHVKEQATIDNSIPDTKEGKFTVNASKVDKNKSPYSGEKQKDE